MRKLTIEQIECLIGWPEGTIGYREEKIALQKLIEVANVVGFGRMSQLAARMERMWTDPDLILPKQIAIRDDRLEKLRDHNQTKD